MNLVIHFLSCVQHLWPPGLQHTRPPYPSPSPGACSNSCPLSWWCHLTVSYSVIPFFSCLPTFPSIRVFSSESALCIRGPKYWRFSLSISPSNEYSGLISFRIDWFDVLVSKGLSRVFSNTTVQKHQFFGAQPSLWSNSHIHTWLLETTGQTVALTRWTFVSKLIFLLSKMLYRLVIAFLPRSKHLLVSWLQSPSAVILEPPKIKSVTVSIVFPPICHEMMVPEAMIFIFWMFNCTLVFSLFPFTFIKRLFNSSLLSVIRMVSSA